MARQIIILNQDASHGDALRFQAAFWLAVPAGRQPMYANPNFASAVKDGSVTSAELTALQNGAVLEVVQSFGYPNGTGLAAIEADLQNQFTNIQTDFNNMANQFASTKMTRYGSFFDGTTWTVKTVA